MNPLDYVSVRATVGWIATAFVVVAICFGAVIGFKSCGRWQARADANNKVRITAIQIRNQRQRVKIATQKADIRYQTAIGIRKSQDEIAKTLTPLYVQFEMVEALKEIAHSGHNNSVVYLPSGANGIPLVSTLPGPVGPPSTGNGG